MKDEHLWPFAGTPGDGTIDWYAVTASLAALPAATPGILEVATGRDDPPEYVTRQAESVFRTLARPAPEPASAPAAHNL
jgi:sugar phosphate isomerase/epimerase